jgi:hypothetical protein
MLPQLQICAFLRLFLIHISLALEVSSSTHTQTRDSDPVQRIHLTTELNLSTYAHTNSNTMLRTAIRSLSHRVPKSTTQRLVNPTVREPSPQHPKTNDQKLHNTSAWKPSLQLPKCSELLQSSMLMTSSAIIEAPRTAAIVEPIPTAIINLRTSAITTWTTSPVVVPASASATKTTAAATIAAKPWPFNLPSFLRPMAGTTYYETYAGISSNPVKYFPATFLQRVLYGDPQPGMRYHAQSVDAKKKR